MTNIFLEKTGEDTFIQALGVMLLLFWKISGSYTQLVVAFHSRESILHGKLTLIIKYLYNIFAYKLGRTLKIYYIVNFFRPCVVLCKCRIRDERRENRCEKYQQCLDIPNNKIQESSKNTNYKTITID